MRGFFLCYAFPKASPVPFVPVRTPITYSPSPKKPKKDRTWLWTLNVICGIPLAWGYIAGHYLGHRENIAQIAIMFASLLLIFDAFAFFGKKGFAALALVLVAWYWAGWAVAHGYLFSTLKPSPAAVKPHPTTQPVVTPKLKTLPSPIDDHVYTLREDIIPASRVKDVEPTYTDEARQAGFNGQVTVELVVTSDGEPENITIINPPGFGLEKNVMDAVRQWRFTPATKDGHPVASRTRGTITFKQL
jgi:protein TonB